MKKHINTLGGQNIEFVGVGTDFTLSNHWGFEVLNHAYV